MELKLWEGRPADTAGRTENEIRTYDFLDALHIPYWRTDHPEVGAYTMEDCREVDAVLGATVCKNLFLTNRQHTAFYLLLMPGDKGFRTKEVSHKLGISRLSFGTPEEMREMIGCAPGSASVMGLMNDTRRRVNLLVDEDAMKGEFYGCHPCANTSSLKLYTRDVFGPFLRAVGHTMTILTLTGERG